MRNCRLLLLLLLCGSLYSCSNRAKVVGTAPDAAGKSIVAKVLGVGEFDAVDTLSVDEDGKFKYSLPIEKGDPRFVSLYYGNTKVASLLLESADRVKVSLDTLGNCSIDGSEESGKLQQVEKDFSDFLRKVSVIKDKGEFVSEYVAHYRKSVRYVMENSHSLTVIPVLHEKINPYAPIFAQTTDALHFRAVCDSLKTVYPESRYVIALEKETVRKENELQMETALKNARNAGFPDISMPGMDGKAVKLSSLKSKVVMLHFWDSSEPALKMFNIDVLKSVYADYHSRGFNIYAVDVNPDKALWGTVVRSQKLPWVNVNDGLGSNSQAVRIYGITEVPASFLIADGNIVNGSVKGETGLRKELARLLK